MPVDEIQKTGKAVLIFCTNVLKINIAIQVKWHDTIYTNMFDAQFH